MTTIFRAPFKGLTPGRYIYASNQDQPEHGTVVTVEDTPLGMAARLHPSMFPTFLKDLPATGSFKEAPPIARRMFDELYAGDRFQRINSLDELVLGEVWTKLDSQTARRHSPESIKLGSQSNGYIGDTICAFDEDDAVSFVPV